MAPAAAFLASTASAVISTGGAIAAAAQPLMAPIGAAMGLIQQQKAAKAGAGAAERAAAIYQQELEFKEKQAGEYFEITKQQMELQAQAGQIRTLANVLQRPPPAEPRVITLPAAKTYSPIENLNRAIGKFLRIA